ncbi:MAG: zinc ribbon domain-containing protein [Acidobacteriia bacterium]|nr:zinc ribbon domain-containing protein [Terriglobia bacterium]
MPIYEYVCNDCKAHYESIVMSASQKVACPRCASERRTLQLSVFSSGKSSNGSSSASSSEASGGGCGCTPHSCGCH